MKAIISTSANPFHYGHLDIYNKAKEIFNDVIVVVAKNPNKQSMRNLEFHLEAYGIKYEILENKTVADYCFDNNIKYIIRGIRNGVDAEYELKLDFANKEINPNIQTLFIPTNDTFANISSSSIRELLNYQKYDIVKKYMNEEAMLRYVNGVRFQCFFGKSCVGKSTWLKRKFSEENIVDVDKYIWEKISEYNGKGVAEHIKMFSNKIVYSSWDKEEKIKRLNYLSNKILIEKFWDYLFEDLIKNNKNIIDWASVGFYYNKIPLKWRSMIVFNEVICDEQMREIRAKNKQFEDKIKFLDELYVKPKIIDNVIAL